MTSTEHRPTELLLNRDVSEVFSEAGDLKVPSSRPTPLIGTWADESWPLNSRQASEMILAEVQRQRSSLIFEDDDGNVLADDDDDVSEQQHDDVDDLHTLGFSELNEAMSTHQHSTEVGDVLAEEQELPSNLESPTLFHVTRCFTHDPYNLTEGYVLQYACYCQSCNAKNNASTATTPNFPAVEEEADYEPLPQEDFEEASVPAPPAPPKALGASPLLSNNNSMTYEQHEPQQAEWDAPAPRLQIPAPRSGFATHTNSTPAPVPPPMHHVPSSTRTVDRDGLLPPYQTTVEITPFMPPPPPPRIMTLVQEEEGNRNASRAFYNVLTRWYGRICDVQECWVAENDRCPAPNKDLYSFEEWADRVSGWWYSHFEHMQKKQPRFPAVARR